MFKLVISDDEGKTTVVPLVRDQVTIGREAGNTIRLTERNVSRQHAKLVRANGAFSVEDLRSYNGVRVNGRKIEGATDLKAGDQIGIGDYLLAVQAEQAEAKVSDAATETLKGPPTAQAKTALLAAPTEPQLPARLVMLTQPAPGAEFALSRDRVRIGRGEDLEAWVNHRSISREHAEVVRDGDGFRVVDLGSANGIRVNSEDTHEAVLSSGDVLELGRVRFRFVNAGEVYDIDEDRTIQGTSEPEPEGIPKAPLIAAAAIVAAAVVIGLAVMRSQDGSDGLLSGVLEGDPAQTPPSSQAPEVSGPIPAGFTEALHACQQALQEGAFEQAVQHAAKALALKPSHTDARACRRDADRGMVERANYELATSHFKAGRLDQAYRVWMDLPEAWRQRHGAEFAKLRDALASARLDQARAALPANPAAAEQHAASVLAIHGVSADLTRAANELRAQAAGGPPEPVPPPRPRARRAPRPPRVAKAPPPRTAPSPPPEPPPAAQPTCAPAAPDYSECIVRTLEGRARSATDLALLIESYRSLGKMQSALRHMQTFAGRYAGHPRAAGYRQILQRYGREVPP